MLEKKILRKIFQGKTWAGLLEKQIPMNTVLELQIKPPRVLKMKKNDTGVWAAKGCIKQPHGVMKEEIIPPIPQK